MLNHVIELVRFVANHFQDILSAVMALLSAVIGVALLIPGEHPEKELQAVVNFLAKFSKKPVEAPKA